MVLNRADARDMDIMGAVDLMPGQTIQADRAGGSLRLSTFAGLPCGFQPSSLFRARLGFLVKDTPGCGCGFVDGRFRPRRFCSEGTASGPAFTLFIVAAQNTREEVFRLRPHASSRFPADSRPSRPDSRS